MDMTLGPFHFEVVEPFRQWRLRLDSDPHRRHGSSGIAFDITWLDTKRPSSASSAPA